MKKIFMMVMGLVACVTIYAQQYQELWITGSAVPGGAQKLIKVSDNDFKYAGRLQAGELRISTTKKLRKGGFYLAPNQPDANIVNNAQASCRKATGETGIWTGYRVAYIVE